MAKPISISGYGLLSERPGDLTAHHAGVTYLATDENGGTVYLWTGTAWAQMAASVSAIGGGTGDDGSSESYRIVEGGGILHVGGLDFRCAFTRYYIGGVLYTSPETVLTLDAADPTDPRFDVIVSDTTGSAVAITGTPAATPSEPSVNPASQIKRGLIFIPAGATEPDVVTEDVYLENTEWASSTSGSGWNANSTNSPRTGSKTIEGTNVGNGAYVQLQRGAAIDVNEFGSLNLFVKSKSSWNAGRLLRIGFYLNGVQKGNLATLASGYWGFDSSNVSDWQLVSIPIPQFAIPAGVTVNQLRIIDSGGSIGLYIDDVTLQSGFVVVSPGGGITQEQADARYLKQSSNLGDLGSASAARTNLGLGTAAVEAASAFAAQNDSRFTAITANNQTDSYTLVLGDAGKVIEMNKGTACTLTVPPNADVAFPIGTVIEVWQQGAGQVTLTPGSGVTIRSNGGALKLSAQYAGAALRKVGTNEWAATGDLTT